MRRTNVLILTSALLVLAGCAGTPDEPEAPAGTATGTPAQILGATDDPGRRVCRRERETGTRISRKVCRTQGEWDRMHEESMESLERNRNQANTVTGGGDS